jgi:transcriptional regulator with XRE-family HTH domain
VAFATMRSMDWLRIGRQLRALRLRAGKRQIDVGNAADLSRQLVSKIERGELADVQMRSLVKIGEALGASLDVQVRWHGEGLDRLMDGAHAGLVELVVRLLERLGWETAVEVSFAIRGERGSIDVMGLHRDVAAVLVVEVKSVVPDAGGMLHVLDRKARLAPEIAGARGWPCASVSRLLVIGDTSTTRRRVRALDATFRTTFPMRGVAVKRWLRQPGETLAGILFLPFATGDGVSRGTTGRQRVRHRKRPESPPKPVQTPSERASENNDDLDLA